MTSDELAVVRRAYALHVLATAGVADLPLERAFAETERERFLGAGPWQIMRSGGYAASPSDDPVYLYGDDLVAIDRKRGLNNGQPSFHALLMRHAAVSLGDHVVHVGTGTGYYTAILARLAGPGGRVTGIEHDAELAAEAGKNLADLPGVEVVAGDGTAAPFDPADVVYVNAGVSRPAASWLDGLKDGGRLLLPLTTSGRGGGAAGGGRGWRGAYFLVTRHGASFPARRITPTGLYPCAGPVDVEAERAVAEAFARSDGSAVTHLHRRGDLPDELCWLKGEGWCLTTA